MAGRTRLPPAVYLAGLGFVLCLLPACLEAFKADEFRLCDQASFCRRHRSVQPGSSRFILQGGLAYQNGIYTGVVVNKQAGVEFRLELAAYGEGILRLVMDESPSKKRYRVVDVLDPALESKRSKLVLTRDGVDGESHLSLGRHKIVIRHDPLRVDAYSSDNEPVLSINGRGQLQYDHLRERKVATGVTEESQEGVRAGDLQQEGGPGGAAEGAQGARQAKEDAQTKQEESLPEDDPGMWEERFRSFTDSKPRGPAAISFDAAFVGVAAVYGLPERATSLALRPTVAHDGSPISEPYRLFNLDVFEFLHESPFGLYGSVPLIWGHGQRGTAGLFWLNAAEMMVDVVAPPENPTVDVISGLEGQPRIDSHWIAESGVLDLFLLLGPDPREAMQQYAMVTGTTALPQLFSLAYHQCRWNYKDEKDVLAVDAGFDEHDIPYDALWLDIEHTDGRKYFTWNHALFPHPKEMQERLAGKGRKMVTIVDPHIKRDSTYPVHVEATSRGYYVKNKDGTDYDAWCWPGSSSYLDMTNPEIRSWWADQFSYSKYEGSTGTLFTWNDMNEPSVFNGPEVSMPRDLLHMGGVEHRDVHNAYGLYFHMASAEGLVRRSGGRSRPFVLSRAFFAGSQRVGAFWTGDNTATWEHLQSTMPMLLSMGIAGVTFTGADVGGYFRHPDPDLLVRWYQQAAFYPFFRGHSHIDTHRREPWLFGEPYTSLISDAIHLRYCLLPYIYTLFRDANVTGMPVLRPLWLEYPQEEQVFRVDNEFLCGSDILVRPVTEKDASAVDVYFPGSDLWYSITDGSPAASAGPHQLPVLGLETFPVFQRGGSIIPQKWRARRSSTQMEDDPYTLVVALNKQQRAVGELYIDDGHSFAFRQGAFIHRRFEFGQGRLSNVDAAPHGASTKGFSTGCMVERIVVLGLPRGTIDLGLTVVVEQGPNKGTRLEAERGPATLRKGVQPNALVVRRPDLKVGADWVIRFAPTGVM